MLQRSYVSVMHGARAWGQSWGWIKLLERHLDRRAALYLRSLMAIHDVEDMAHLDVPWWSFSSIDNIDSFLKRCGGGAHVFEYGPGASTIWLARRCAAVSFVEHDNAWWKTFSPMIDGLENVTGQFVPPRLLGKNEYPVCQSDRKDWRNFDFEDYVAAIVNAGGPFDAIIIDGRARTACLSAAIDHLNEDGLIVFDNSGRSRYQAAITACGLATRRYRGLTPALPYPSETTLLARHRSIVG